MGSLAYHQKELIMKSVRRSSSKPTFFEVDLWFTGKRETVYVDEQFPVGLRPRLAKTQYFWAAIMEKAYAKYGGSYDFLGGGSNYESLYNLTGEPTSRIDIKDVDESKLRDYLSAKYIVTGGYLVRGRKSGH